jgi:hypothetical protein
MITTEAPRTRTLTVPVVALVVAIALAAVLVAASVGAARRVADARDEAAAARRDAALARGEGGVGDVIAALQGERALAATSLLGSVDTMDLPFASMDEAAAATDAAIADARAGGGSTSAVLERALPGLEPDLPDLRARVTGPGSISRIDEVEDIDAGYAAAIDALVDADHRLAASIGDRDLRHGAELIDLADRQVTLRLDVVRHLLLAIPGGGIDTSEEVAAAGRERAEMVANDAEMARLATGRYRAPAAELADDPELREFAAAVDAALASPSGPSDVTELIGLQSGPTSPYVDFTIAVGHRIDERAVEVRRDALRRQALFSVLALAAVVLATALVAGATAWVVVRARRRARAVAAP